MAETKNAQVTAARLASGWAGESAPNRSRPGRRSRLGRVAMTIALMLPLATQTPHAEQTSRADWTPAKSEEADVLVTRFLARVDAQNASLPRACLALAIGSDRGRFLAKGFGECAPGGRATEHTVFHVGSLAKQFTAAAVLDLMHRHAKLRTGTPVALDLPLAQIFNGVDHWPGREEDGEGVQPVTIRSLLTMTSNLPNFTRQPPSSVDPHGRIGAPQLLAEVKKMKPWGWPNTFEYSNTSYFLLSEIVEEVVAPGEAAPRSHHDYLRAEIFRRADLHETGFVGDYGPNARVAQPIHRRPPVFDQPDWLKGSADVASSASDLFNWNGALMSGRVIPAEAWRLMVSDGARVTPSIYYGMGWFVEHRPAHDVYFHSGLVPGFTSHNIIAAAKASPSWTSVTLLLNTDGVDGLEQLAEELLRLASD